MANSFNIGNVIPRLFNGSKYETDVRTSNPISKQGNSNNFFMNSGLKVNVLTADVFETTSFTGAGNTATNSISKIKRMASTFVGSLGDAFPTFRQGIENIAAFCGRVKNNITSVWNYLHETKIPGIMDITRAIKSKWETAQYNKEVAMYTAQPVSTLENMLKDSLSVAA